VVGVVFVSSFSGFVLAGAHCLTGLFGDKSSPARDTHEAKRAAPFAGLTASRVRHSSGVHLEQGRSMEPGLVGAPAHNLSSESLANWYHQAIGSHYEMVIAGLVPFCAIKLVATQASPHFE